MYAGGISAQYPVFGRSPIGGEIYGAVPYGSHERTSVSVSTVGGPRIPVATVTPLDAPEILHRPPDYMTLAVITTLCCNVCCGLVALLFSVASNGASSVGDFEAARRHGKMSLTLSVIGIAITVVLVTAFTIYGTVSSMETVEQAIEGWEEIEANAHDLDYADYYQ